MIDIIYWLLDKIGILTNFVLNFHIIGNLSLLHFIIAFSLLVLILNFLSFGHFNLNTFTSFGSYFIDGYKNAENRKDKKNYYNSVVTVRTINGHGGVTAVETDSYVGRTSYKTGEFFPKYHKSTNVLSSDYRRK